jgi:hypothetical protein
VEDVIAEGDRVVVRGTDRGTHKASSWAKPPAVGLLLRRG